MGRSATYTELARKLERAGTDLGQAATRKRAVEASALVAKDIYNDEAAKAGLPPGSMLAGRKWGGYGFKIRGDDSALVEPRGPVWLHNTPTRRHLILPKGERGNVLASGPVLPGMAQPVVAQAGRKRRKAGADSLRFNARHAAIVNHPGTRGRRWASKAVKRIEEKSPEVYMKEASSVWRAVFR